MAVAPRNCETFRYEHAQIATTLKQLFLSCVSAEFKSCRETLRHDLDRPDVAVKVQEDFVAYGAETLYKLDDYIRHCEAVIHLVGDMTGAPAGDEAVTALRQAYPDLLERLPPLTSLNDHQLGAIS